MLHQDKPTAAPKAGPRGMRPDSGRKVESRATDRQVRFAFDLFERAGYSTQFVGEQHERFGARAIGQSLEGWLKSLTQSQISRVINTLREEL